MAGAARQIWDNRCVNHRARPFDRSSEARVLIGTRIRGEPETEAADGTMAVVQEGATDGEVPELVEALAVEAALRREALGMEDASESVTGPAVELSLGDLRGSSSKL